MNLQAIETLVLSNIGYDGYAALSVDTDPLKMADFAMLHNCVNLAREEIKLNTKLACLTMFGTAIVTAAGISGYNLPNDFDIPIAMYYWAQGNSSATLLKQYYVESLPASVPVTIGAVTPATGTPYGYIIAGTSADLIQIYIIDTPDTAGVILPLYKPVLTALTLAADEDVLMRKYPKTIIDFASAFAFQYIKKDGTNHDKYYGLGLAECLKIDFRENGADSNYKELPPMSIINARIARMSR